MSEAPPGSMHPSRAVGRTFTLLLIPTGSAVAFGPAWAALSGACMGMKQWWIAPGATIASDLARLADPASALDTAYPRILVTLLLTVFVAEALWSTWRALLLEMDWIKAAVECPPSGQVDIIPGLPYITPWSPLGSLLWRWRRIWRWAHEVLPAEKRAGFFSLPILGPLILLISAAVSRYLFLLSCAALALSAVERLAARHGRRHYSLQAALEITFSWLAGHIVFGQPTWPSLTLACCYALAYQGVLSCEGSSLPGSNKRHSWALALLYGGQISATVLLVLLQRPLAAMIVGVLVAPQLLLLPRLGADARSLPYLRRAVPFLMMAMPVAAWAV